MVLRQSNGDLMWAQDGLPVCVSPDQPSMWAPADETEIMQVEASKKNVAASDAYLEKLQAMQDTSGSTKPIAHGPAKPKFILVTDPVMVGLKVTAGVKSEIPWPGGLPEPEKAETTEEAPVEKAKSVPPPVHAPTPPPPTPPPHTPAPPPHTPDPPRTAKGQK
jgi:hypothetical protein